MNFKSGLLFLFSVFSVAVSAQKVFEIHPAAFTEDTIPCIDPRYPADDGSDIPIDIWKTPLLEYRSYLASPVFSPFNPAQFAYAKRVFSDYGKKQFNYIVVADFETGRKDTLVAIPTNSSNYPLQIRWIKPDEIIFLQKDTLFKVVIGSKIITVLRTKVAKIVSTRDSNIVVMDAFKSKPTVDYSSKINWSTNLRFINSAGLGEDTLQMDAPYLETDFSKDSFWLDARPMYTRINVMKYKSVYKWDVMPFAKRGNQIANPHFMKWNPLQSTEWYMFNGGLYLYNFATDSLTFLRKFCRLKSFGEFDVSADGKWILVSSSLHIHTAEGGYCVNKSQLTLIRLSDLHEFIYVDR